MLSSFCFLQYYNSISIITLYICPKYNHPLFKGTKVYKNAITSKFSCHKDSLVNSIKKSGRVNQQVQNQSIIL